MPPIPRVGSHTLPTLAIALLLLAAPRSGEAVAPPPAPVGADSAEGFAALMEAGRFPQAVRAAEQEVTTLGSARPAAPASLADALDRLLDALHRDGRWHTSRYAALAERVVALREGTAGDTSRATAAAWNRLADVRAEAGDHETAARFYRRSLAVRERLFGARSLEASQTRVGLSVVRRDTGHGAEAESLLLVSLDAWLDRFPVRTDDALKTARDLVQGIWNAGDYAQSRYYFENTVRIWDRVARRGDLRLLMLLGSIPELFESQREVVVPAELLEMTFETVDALVGEAHPDVVLALEGFGALLQISGDLASSRKAFERGFERAHQLLRPTHPDAILATLNLGGSLESNGDHAGARSRFEGAIALIGQEMGNDHPFMALALDHCGDLLVDVGDHDGGRRLLERGFHIRERRLGPAHPDVAGSLTSLAACDIRARALRPAREKLLRAKRIWECSVGPEDYQIISTLGGLAQVDLALGQLDSARVVLRRKRELIMRLPRQRIIDVASSEHELARIAMAYGDTAAARRGFALALSSLRTLFGPEMALAAVPMRQLALLDLMRGDRDEAIRRALEVERLTRDNLRNTIATLPERQAVRYALSRETGLDVVLSVAAAAQGATLDVRRAALDALVRSRAVVLDEIGTRHRPVPADADSGVRALYADYLASRQRVANLGVRGPGELPPERYRLALESALRERESRERALAERSAEFRHGRAREHVGLADVAAALPEGSALVSFVRYRHALAADSAPVRFERGRVEYAAFVLLAGDSVPSVARLGSAARLDSLVERWRHRVATPSKAGSETALEALERREGEALRAATWDPAAALLADRTRVFVVPDGALHLVNLYALPTAGGGYLVETGLVVQMLSAERDLAPADTRVEPNQGLLAIGGIDYERASAEAPRAPVVRNARPAEEHVDLSARRRGHRAGRLQRAHLHFVPLPQSAIETSGIARSWERATSHTRGMERGATAVLLGAGASEAAFKALAHRYETIHVATHGFFVGGEAEAPLSAAARASELADPLIAAGGESPLLLCGLALAGANNFRSARPDQEDGILTGEEIAALDLSGVRWVVLSACGTGTGRLVSGEGVFGLHRAFKLARAGTVIMSLWPVDDEATRRWMEVLYEARLTRGFGAARAVHEASRALLAERRAAGKSTRALWWGGFVATGEWQ